MPFDPSQPAVAEDEAVAAPPRFDPALPAIAEPPTAKPRMSVGEMMLSQAEFEQQDIKPIELPVVGAEGSFTRGASKAVSGLVQAATTPEGVALGAAMLVPGVGQVLGPVLGAAAVKQAAQLAGEWSVTGNPETAGEASVLGTVGVLGTALPMEKAALDAVKANAPGTGAALESGKAVLEEAVRATGETAKASETAVVPSASPLQTAWDRYDNGPATISELANEVEALVAEGNAPKELGKLVEDYREAVRVDREDYGQRSGLPEDAGEALANAVAAQVKPEVSPTIAVAPVASDTFDISPVNAATTEAEVLKVGGGLIMQAKTAEEIAAVQQAMRQRSQEISGLSAGPGAASPGDIPTAPQLAQLTETLKAVSPVKQPLSAQVRNQFEAVREQLSTRAENALGTLRSIGASAMAALRGEHEWTDFKDALGRFSGEQNRTDYALQQFTREIRRAVPDKLRREAIVNWIQADGDPALLAERASQSRGYARGYELAQDLTPDEMTLADNVRSYLDAKLKEGIDAGILKAGLDNYITQIWDRPNPITQRLVGEVFTGKLAPNFRYARQRIFDSYFEGEQAGYKPKVKDVGALTAIYDQAFSRAVASRRLIKSLHEGVASDGRPLVEVSGMTSAVRPEPGASPDAILIKPKARPEDVGDYLPIDHPALRGWRWAGKDENGAPIFYHGDLLVHPEVHRNLKNVLSTSWFRQNVFTRSLLSAMSLAKQTKLSLSGFHFTQEAAHAAAHRVNPAAPVKIDFADATQAALVDHGLQVADYRAYQAFAEGLSGAGGLLEKIPVIGRKAIAPINEYLFQEYIPRLKMSMALDALERNRQRFAGKLSDDQILELTANQGNAAFGELNYNMLARNPTMQDMWRLVLLAPDFLEARGRFMAQAMTKTGTEQRVALGLQALALYTAARILNTATSGDPHWEPEAAFSVFANGRSYSLRTVTEDAFRAVSDPGAFIRNRLAPLAKATSQFVTGRGWTGGKMTALEQVKDFADWFVPISLDKQEGHTRVDQVLAASGMVVKKATAQMQLYKRLDEFKSEHNLLTKEEKEGLRAASEYAPLRRALEADDLAAAKREYDRLLAPTDNTKAKTPQQIHQHFAASIRQPFSGSPRLEQQFLRSLDKGGKDLYLAAQKERRATAEKFIAAQKGWQSQKR